MAKQQKTFQYDLIFVTQTPYTMANDIGTKAMSNPFLLREFSLSIHLYFK